MAGSNFVDVVRFTAASAGTGSFVVSAAVTGYQTPATAGAVTATQYSYRAESSDLTQWEVGQGTYTSSNTAITRTPLFNSVGGSSAISFTVAPQVGFVALGEDLFIAVSKAQQQTGTSVVNTVTPAQQQSHDSAAKAWAFISSSGALNASYNVASVSHSTGSGTYVITWTTAFATANYAVVASAQATTATGIIAFGNGATFNSSNCQINCVAISTSALGGSVLTDPSIGLHVVAYGRQ